MATTYKPLTVELLDEGRVLRALEAEFKTAQRALCIYADKHGDKSAKAKATVTLKLEIEVVNPDDGGQFVVLAKIDSKAPARPVKVTSAFGELDEEGRPSLFARASGSTEGDPRQMVLATEDGDLVDPKTGEVVKRG